MLPNEPEIVELYMLKNDDNRHNIKRIFLICTQYRRVVKYVSEK